VVANKQANIFVRQATIQSHRMPQPYLIHRGTWLLQRARTTSITCRNNLWCITLLGHNWPQSSLAIALNRPSVQIHREVRCLSVLLRRVTNSVVTWKMDRDLWSSSSEVMLVSAMLSSLSLGMVANNDTEALVTAVRWTLRCVSIRKTVSRYILRYGLSRSKAYRRLKQSPLSWRARLSVWIDRFSSLSCFRQQSCLRLWLRIGGRSRRMWSMDTRSGWLWLMMS